MSIRLKLTITFLAVALIPLFFVSALTFTHYKNSLETTRLFQTQDLAAFKMKQIETYFTDLKADIDIAQDYYNIRKNLPLLTQLAHDTSDPEFIDARKMLDEQLQPMQSILSLNDIMLASAEGKIVYSTNPKHAPNDFLNLLPDVGHKAFEQGKKGIYFSDVYLNTVDSNKFSMLVTAPVLDFDDIFVGVVAFEVDMAPLYHLLQEVTGLGNTGEVLVGKKMGNQVVYLNPLRHDPDAALKRFITIGEEIGIPIQEAAQGKNGVGQSIDYRGKKVISAWRYIPSLGWGMVAKIDIEEAFADVANLRKLVFIILVIVCVLAGLMAISIAQSISGPIKKLSKGVEIIGSGNLDYRVGNNSQDEIGQLSRTFDKMTEDLKKADVLRDAERQRLYDVLETLPVYVILLSKDYHVPFANRFFRERFGESGGKRCYEYLFNRTEPCENCETYKVLKTNAPHHWEWTGPDGRNYDIYDFPFTDTDGSRMVMEMGIDITEQKRAQDSLRLASQYARSLIEASLDPLVTISADGKITDVNEGTIKATGASRDQLVGTDFSKYFTEPEKAEQGYQQVFANGFVTNYPLTMHHNDGHLTDVLYNATVYKDAHNNVLGVFAAARDVTARKRAEEELEKYRHHLEGLVKERSSQLEESNAQLQTELAERKRAEEAVRHAFDRYRSYIEVTGQVGWATNIEGEVTEDMPSWRKFTGQSYEEIKGCGWANALHPDDVAHTTEVWKKALKERSNYETEYRMRRHDGVYRQFLARGVPIFGEDGTTREWIGVCIDITERKKDEDELKRSNENLEQFAYVASHDLQEPLRIMSSYSQLLEKRYKDKFDQDANDFIGFIVDAAQRMQKLITDLLAYSRVGRKDVSVTEVDFNELVDKLILSLSPTVESIAGKVTHNELPVLLTHETSMLQLFQNLIGNALKFRREEEPKIHIEARKNGYEWIFSVQDNGLGIEPQYYERIFQIFQRLHTKEAYDGTGIGLSICKKIVENYGGKIWVESELGKGSIFYFTVPLNRW
jgi:PAS domain S-box-containing protein